MNYILLFGYLGFLVGFIVLVVQLLLKKPIKPTIGVILLCAFLIFCERVTK